VISEIRGTIESIEDDATLLDAGNFSGRADAIERIELHVIDRIEGLLDSDAPPPGLTALRRRAEEVRRRLEGLDEELFRGLQDDIRGGGCRGAALRARIERLAGHHPGVRGGSDEVGYDVLDVFVSRLLLSRPLSLEAGQREPEMVFYQPTPIRIVFELIDEARLTGDDLFYDLGSGLGQVPILVNLLGGVPARGVEIEPVYCDYATACAADLGLSGVTFSEGDARVADYSGGTVFFMYTPFHGSILREVLERLREEARRRRIRLFTYGPCAAEVSRQSWLERASGGEHRRAGLAAFRSV